MPSFRKFRWKLSAVKQKKSTRRRWRTITWVRFRDPPRGSKKPPKTGYVAEAKTYLFIVQKASLSWRTWGQGYCSVNDRPLSSPPKPPAQIETLLCTNCGHADPTKQVAWQVDTKVTLLDRLTKINWKRKCNQHTFIYLKFFFLICLKIIIYLF